MVPLEDIFLVERVIKSSLRRAVEADTLSAFGPDYPTKGVTRKFTSWNPPLAKAQNMDLQKDMLYSEVLRTRPWELKHGILSLRCGILESRGSQAAMLHIPFV